MLAILCVLVKVKGVILVKIERKNAIRELSEAFGRLRSIINRLV